MNNHFDFSWKFGEYEIRTVHENYDNVNRCFDKKSPIRKNCPIELVKWQNNFSSCYVVAWFRKDDECYEFFSVGNRLFEEIDENEISIVWTQLRAAAKMLSEYYEAERISKWND